MEPTEKQPLDQVRDAIRLKHCSIRTEEAHTNWIKRYIYFYFDDIRHRPRWAPRKSRPFSPTWP